VQQQQYVALRACRLIADVFAGEGFLTVVPDYFQGEPMNIALLETYEALPSMSLLGKLGGYVQLAGQIVGMVSRDLLFERMQQSLPTTPQGVTHIRGLNFQF
jgi:hypothetical protein